MNSLFLIYFITLKMQKDTFMSVMKYLVPDNLVMLRLCFPSTVFSKQVKHSLEVLKMPPKCVTLPLAASTLTHIQHQALNVWAEEKWSFCICGCCYLFKQQQREQCDVSNHICYASHSILPTRRASREVSGTVEQQPSLECMCHYGINSEPWLMFCICNHLSQHCHRSGQRTRVSSWMVWADLVLV